MHACSSDENCVKLHLSKMYSLIEHKPTPVYVRCQILCIQIYWIVLAYLT